MSKTFTAKNPATGQPVGSEILEWDQDQTNAAIKAAANAKHKLSATTPTQRAAVLNAIADAINPTRLKSIRSIKTFGSGNKNLKKRWVIKRKKPIHLRT